MIYFSLHIDQILNEATFVNSRHWQYIADNIRYLLGLVQPSKHQKWELPCHLHSEDEVFRKNKSPWNPMVSKEIFYIILYVSCNMWVLKHTLYSIIYHISKCKMGVFINWRFLLHSFPWTVKVARLILVFRSTKEDKDGSDYWSHVVDSNNQIHDSNFPNTSLEYSWKLVFW